MEQTRLKLSGNFWWFYFIIFSKYNASMQQIQYIKHFPKTLVLFVLNIKTSRCYFSEFVSYFILQNLWKSVKYISWENSNTLFNKRGEFHHRRNRKTFSIKNVFSFKKVQWQTLKTNKTLKKQLWPFICWKFITWH